LFHIQKKLIKFRNILIIDDDIISNMLTRDELIISQLAENVEVAFDVEEGLTMLKKFYLQKGNIPELILLDVNMPDRDGFEFLREFNELGLFPKPKIIMVSSSIRPQDIERSKILDAFGYIIKPFTLEKLGFVLKMQIN
jgi:CheY-like chemotaxis protein